MATAVEIPHTSSPVRAERSGPLFVLSVWRSGSSLLYALLNQHSKIALLYEGDLPRLHMFLFGRFRSGSWRERWEFWNQGPSRHGIAIESMPARVLNAWDATRKVYQAVARRKQAIIWGEKTPHWYDCPLYMAEQFPDARFIFLWRDVNAVMASICQAALSERFFKKAGFAHRVLVGTEKLRQACDVLRSRGQLVHEVNYEDLISDTPQCMQLVCEFLELPFESQTASLEGADRSAIASGEHHAMVRRNRVVASKKSADLPPDLLRAKIARYVCRWRRHSNGTWPKYPVELPDGVQPANWIELCSDRIVYQVVRGRDKMVAVIYALVPISVARWLRSLVRQRGPAKAGRL
jgi:Sulfotransferase family